MTTSDKPSTIGQSNLRYYWIIFGVLLISFAFPVRILSNWWITYSCLFSYDEPIHPALLLETDDSGCNACLHSAIRIARLD